MKKLLLQTLSVVSVSIGLSLVSCSDDYQELVQNDSPPVRRTQSHKLTLRQAMDRSVGILSESKSVPTRSVDNIKSVDYITSPLKTRASTPDTLFYLVNFENEEGFLLMTTDDRLLPVYAFSDTGCLNLADTVYNEPLRNYMNGVTHDVSWQMSKPRNWNPPFPHVTIDEFEKDKSITPKLSVFQSRIGQGSPYNACCPIILGKRTVAGCAPVAFEMLMSYHRYPRSYKEDTFDWETMNEGSNTDAIARLLAHLGAKENLNTNYGQISLTNIKNYYLQTFKNFGYNEPLCDEFSTERADRALYSGPIIVWGSGHAWVIDGLRRLVSPPFEEGGERLYWRYFHCVWGWDGNSNGFYYVGGNKTDAEDYYYWDYDLKTGNSPQHTISSMIYDISYD